MLTLLQLLLPPPELSRGPSLARKLRKERLTLARARGILTSARVPRMLTAAWGPGMLTTRRVRAMLTAAVALEILTLKMVGRLLMAARLPEMLSSAKTWSVVGEKRQIHRMTKAREFKCRRVTNPYILTKRSKSTQ